MKTELKVISPLVACLAGTLLLCPGCGLFRSSRGAPPATFPAPIAKVSVVANGGRAALKAAIIKAATRRRWTPEETAPDVIRCTLVQRQHKVEIDVRLTGDSSYSVTCVSCNIPVKKYDQWVNNLQRDIAKFAAASN